MVRGFDRRRVMLIFVLCVVGVLFAGNSVTPFTTPDSPTRVGITDSGLQIEFQNNPHIEGRTGVNVSGDPGRTTYWIIRPDGVYSVNSTKVERLVHQKVNEKRVATGQSALNHSDAYSSVARAHSYDMATEQYFSHRTPTDESPVDRMVSGLNGSECMRIGENIALNWVGGQVRNPVTGETEVYLTEEEIASAIVAQWMSSDGHRENLQKPYWDREGVGVYISPDGEVYVTQTFCEIVSS